MNELWIGVGRWLCHLAWSGGAILFLTWLVVRHVQRPARQQRIAEAGLGAALLVGVASLFPAWIIVPVPATWLGDSEQTRFSIEQITSQDDPRAAADEEWLNATDSLGTARTTRLINLRESMSPGERDSDATPVRSAGPLPLGQLRVLTMAILPYLGVVYAAVAALVAGYWLLGCIALARLVASARPAAEHLRSLFCRMAHHPYPRLLVSRRLPVPLCFGLRQPTVVVPAVLANQPDADKLRWVFAHELTHLERHDVLSSLLFAAGQCVFFFVPWYWALRRQVRLCQEYIADAAAVEASGNPAAYAEFLLSLSTAAAPPVGAAAATGNPSDLFRRVTMLLENGNKLERHCPRWWSLGAASALTVLALGTAGVGLRASNATTSPALARATSDDEQKKDAPKAEKPKAKLNELPAQGYFTIVPNPAPTPYTQALPLIIQGKQNFNTVDPRSFWLYSDGTIALDNSLVELQPSGRLGIQVKEMDATLTAQLGLEDGKGLVITPVDKGSAAEKAGLKVHDVLLKFNGEDVQYKPADLVKKVQAVKKGAAVDLVLLRKGKKVTIENIMLAEKKKQVDLTIPLETLQKPYVIQQLDPNVTQNKFLLDRLNQNFQQGHIFVDSSASMNLQSGQGIMISNFRSNENFTGRHQEGSLIITVTGKVQDGKSTLSQIQVQDGKDTKKYEAVKEVPEQYRDKVKNLVEMSEKTNIKIDIPAQPGGKQPAKKKKDKSDSKDSKLS